MWGCFSSCWKAQVETPRTEKKHICECGMSDATGVSHTQLWILSSHYCVSVRATPTDHSAFIWISSDLHLDVDEAEGLWLKLMILMNHTNSFHEILAHIFTNTMCNSWSLLKLAEKTCTHLSYSYITQYCLLCWYFTTVHTKLILHST